MKKIIVISTSLRHGSNSNILAEKFIEGAKAAGNEVEKISLVGQNIQFCKGCMACQKQGRCVIKDDVNSIMAKVLKADVICWATPIYYYEMSGQMKTLIDRMNAMYEQDYRDPQTCRDRTDGLDRLLSKESSGRYALLRRRERSP